MIARIHHPGFVSRTAALFAFGLCLSLAGCADMGDSFASSAFVDPAKYDNYDCRQLEGERKALASRTAELQGLMAKAQTGTGGSAVAELAYGNDYIAARGQSRLAEEVWQRNKCVATSPVVAVPAAPSAMPATPAQGKGRGSTR